VVLAGPVSWEIGGRLVADDFGANLQLLYVELAEVRGHIPGRVHAFRCTSSASLGPVIFAVLRQDLVISAGRASSNFFDRRRAKDRSAPGPTRRELNWYHHRCRETPLQRHALSSPLYTPLRPPTGTQSEPNTRCPPPLRVWPATPPSGCV
jgi:hypothetical protein